MAIYNTYRQEAAVRRWTIVYRTSALALLAVSLTCCSAINDPNSIAIYQAKHPDKVLFDAATKAIERDHFDVARMTLQTLVNTYPHSEYAKNAKTALEDPRMNPCYMAWMVPIPTFAPLYAERPNFTR